MLKTKDEAFNAYLAYEALAENQTGRRILRFQYVGKKWNEHFSRHGITHEHTVKGIPQQNGIAKCTNHTITKDIVAMLQ